MSLETNRYIADNLRIEYEVSPVGLDPDRARFFWQVRLLETEGTMLQSAYQLQVAADSSFSDDLLWDSGKVNDERSREIIYAGPQLSADSIYHWRVRLWDHQGQVSQWSDTAQWSTGLRASDWQAKWITTPEGLYEEEASIVQVREQSRDLSAAAWIARPPAERTQTTVDMYAGEMTYVRLVFASNPQKSLKAAWLCAAGDCRPLIYMNGERAATAYHYRYPTWTEITDFVQSGDNTLGFMLNNSIAYDTGVDYAALCARLTLLYEDGEVVTFDSDAQWECAAVSEPDWIHGPDADSPWQAAHVEAAFGGGPWGAAEHFQYPPQPFHPFRSQVFHARKAIEVTAPIQRAVLYATALGVFEVEVDGAPLDDRVLNPGWTDYTRHIPVQAYDVTAALNQGEHVLGFTVSPGWYSGCVGMFGPYQYGVKPQLLAQLHLTYADGRQVCIMSDESWVTAQGALQFADLLMGEIYDARQAISGWSQPGPLPEPTRWQAAVQGSGADEHAKLIAFEGPPSRVVAELAAQSVTEQSPGVYIVDFGQNLSGWMRLKVNGPSGTSVQMRFAEMCNEDGSVYVTNLRSARATDVYILHGQGDEVYEPRHTFHGFRYAEVTGYPGVLRAEDVTAYAVASDTSTNGDFSSSDPMINQLYSNIVWGQRGNFLSVPTDCPQRDERLAWTGDAQIFVRTSAYNMDVAAFFGKWMRDVRDAQRENGAITNVAPHLGWLQAGIAGWGEAVIIVPWTIWQFYGDTQIVRDNYEAMNRFMDYVRTTAPQWIRPAIGFGDWLSIEADTPKDLLATAFFAYCADKMQQMAQELGYLSDATRYEEWAQEIRAAFVQTFVEDQGRLHGHTQTAYVLALHMKLLPDHLVVPAVNHLVADIVQRGNRLSTGFIGVSYLLPVLTRYGHVELAFQLLEQDQFPSWLYSVKQGATTIWERWNGWTAEHGFYSAVMNSFNHYSLGSVGEWMFRYVAGIDWDDRRPGFKHFRLQPHIGGSLQHAQSQFDSPYGAIHSAWKIRNGQVVYQAQVPQNSEAQLQLPLAQGTSVWLDEARSALATEQSGATIITEEEQAALTDTESMDDHAPKVRYRLQPGSYTFVWAYSK